MSDDDKYDVLEKIGQGSFGIIRKVQRKTDGYVLCRKEISYSRMSQKEKEQLQAELSILKELRHPNIVAYIDKIHLKATHDLHVYMEYCGNGDLGQVIKKLKSKRQYADEEFVWSIFSQLVTALYRCHYGQDAPEAGRNVMGLGNDAVPVREKQKHLMILHRDLKPENVFLGADNSVKLGDFGLSKILQSHDFASTYVGTPYYMSPEICMSEKYTLYSDIWALGCIIYELCTWKPPFDAKTHFELIQKIRAGRFDPLPSVYSPELRKVVDSCLNVNATRRPETAQLLNLPIVKLMRKEQEVVQLGQQLKKERDLAKQMNKEANEKLAIVEKEKDAMRVAIDAQIRREWEVKARLEIDRQVQVELEKLRKTFEDEVSRRVEQEVALRLHAMKVSNATTNEVEPSSTPSLDATIQPHASISTLGEPSDFPSQTDISSLSLESPVEPQPQPRIKVKATTPTKARPARQGFQRAHTTAFNEIAASPMDIHMADPSPISLAGLSLSPRREVQAMEPRPRRNIFAAAAERWEPTAMSSPPASPTADMPSPGISADDEDDDDLPVLPSPTRPRSNNGRNSSSGNRKMASPPENDPFKVLAAADKPAVPAGLLNPLSRRTALKNGPLPNRNPSAPNLTRLPGGPSTRPRPTSTVPVVATSPARRRSAKLSGDTASTSPVRKGSAGSADAALLDLTRDTAASALRSKKGAMSSGTSGAAVLRQQAAARNNQLAGRTLVELAQGRAAASGGSDTAGDNTVAEKRTIAFATQVAKWEIEDPDCPSPFLRKNIRPRSEVLAGVGNGLR